MGRFWKNGKRSRQWQRLLPSNEHCMCLQQWYARLLGELPSRCKQMLLLPFPEEETEVTFLVGGKTILPDSDTNTEP